MSTASRWYAYLVCFISLQAVVWALIALARLLLTPGEGEWGDALALDVAIIVIAFPVYLGHWLWVRRQAEERASTVARLYLYVILGVLLVPILANAYDLLAGLLALPFPDAPHWGASGASTVFVTSLIHALAALVILGAFWTYHRLVLTGDARTVPDTGITAVIRRLYLLLFSGSGLTMTALAFIGLLEWLFRQFPLTTRAIPLTTGWTDYVALLLVGGALAYLCWRQAQQLFRSGREEEQQSLLRKLYLYVVVFISAISTVTSLTILLTELLRRLFSLPTPADLRLPIAVMLVLATVWAYHAVVLREDVRQADEVPRQANIRRLYCYLVATIGLSAFLIGLAGAIGGLISLLDTSGFGETIFAQLAWSIAALVVGLFVWIVPWRAAQQAADAEMPDGELEREALVRRIYLYFFLFVAAVTVLADLVAIAYTLLSRGLGHGGDTPLVSALAQAVANTLIGAGLWAYHLAVVRADARVSRREQAAQVAAIRIAVLDGGDGTFGRAVLERLGREWPGATLLPVGLTPAAVAAMGEPPASVPAALADATLIIASWYAVLPGAAEIARAVDESPAPKLLVPLPAPAYAWVGLERWNLGLILRQLTQSVRAALDGKPISYTRPLSADAIIGFVIGILLLPLLLVLAVIVYLMLNNALM
jgi:hypothetical protein